MLKIPKFRLYGLDDQEIEGIIQPRLNLRGWCDLDKDEKGIALQELINNGWVEKNSEEILQSIKHLNYKFLRECPGRHLHETVPAVDYRGFGSDYASREAAFLDFKNILLYSGNSEALILRMLSVFASRHIKEYYFNGLEKEKDDKKIEENINNAFEKFDRLANCLNHIFEQFSVNVILTRNGLIPRQDEKITQLIYEPTLKILSDPKWKAVSDDLSDMFSEYSQKNYPETITKAHRTVQRFLQILVGEEGKNSKGELSNLFKKAKEQGILPANRFTEPIISVFQSFIPSERATKSTAKPAKEQADSQDVLLVMNVVMIFLQFCLQKIK